MLDKYVIKVNGNLYGVYEYHGNDFQKARDDAWALATRLEKAAPDRTVTIELHKVRTIHNSKEDS